MQAPHPAVVRPGPPETGLLAAVARPLLYYIVCYSIV